MENTKLLELRGIGRDYLAGEETLTVLEELDLTIEVGEMVAIVGPSGSGKSTLMHIIGCLDQPSRGHYRIQGRDVGGMSPDDLATLRRDHFGFIFQQYHLLSNLNALANVEMPAVYAGRDRSWRRRQAAQLLARLEMGRERRKPASEKAMYARPILCRERRYAAILARASLQRSPRPDST